MALITLDCGLMQGVAGGALLGWGGLLMTVVGGGCSGALACSCGSLLRSLPQL